MKYTLDDFALERAKKHGIETHVVSRKEFGKQSSDKILELVKGKVDLIVLAGFLSILDGEILREFENKIINIPLIQKKSEKKEKGNESR